MNRPSQRDILRNKGDRLHGDGPGQIEVRDIAGNHFNLLYAYRVMGKTHSNGLDAYRDVLYIQRNERAALAPHLGDMAGML